MMTFGRIIGGVAVLVAALLATTGTSSATSFSTDSWGCGWSGGSAAGPYSWTSAAGWCALAAGVQVDYYIGGQWYSYQWVWVWVSTYAQQYAAGSLSSQHQIYVSGQGYGQNEYSSY